MTHIGPDQPRQSIPRRVEDLYDTIEGLLRCSECGELLGNGREWLRSRDKGDVWYYALQPGRHVCDKDKPFDVDWLLSKGISFPYDYASPLTIREQLKEWIKGHKPLNSAPTESFLILRCSGYKILPDGTPCLGCPDCEVFDPPTPQKPIRNNKNKAHTQRKRTMYDD